MIDLYVTYLQGWGRSSKFEQILDTDTCLPPGTADPVRYSNSANFTDPDTDTVTDTNGGLLKVEFLTFVAFEDRRVQSCLENCPKSYPKLKMAVFYKLILAQYKLRKLIYQQLYFKAKHAWKNSRLCSSSLMEQPHLF